MIGLETFLTIFSTFPNILSFIIAYGIINCVEIPVNEISEVAPYTEDAFHAFSASLGGLVGGGGVGGALFYLFTRLMKEKDLTLAKVEEIYRERLEATNKNLDQMREKLVECEKNNDDLYERVISTTENLRKTINDNFNGRN